MPDMTDDIGAPKPPYVVVVMACFNDWESICVLVPEIEKQIAQFGMEVEILIIDDGSTSMHKRDAIKDLKLRSTRSISVLELTRNYGNQRANAIGVGYASEHYSDAAYMVLMDSDMEDVPTFIPPMIRAARERDDSYIIFAERTERGESLNFRIGYWFYQKIYRVLTGREITAGNFSVVPGRLIGRLSTVGEIWNHYASGVMRSRIPYTMIPASRGVRMFGESKMDITSLITHAFSGFSVYLDVILVRAFVAAGWFTAIMLTLSAIAVWARFFTDLLLSGWTTIVLLIVFSMLLQIFGALTVLMFVHLSIRLQRQIIPAREYQYFVSDLKTHYSRDNERV